MLWFCLRYCKFQIKMEHLSMPPVTQLCQSSSAVLNHNLPTSAILHKGGDLDREHKMWRKALISALFTIHPNWNPWRFSTVGKQLSKLWYIPKMKFYTAA